MHPIVAGVAGTFLGTVIVAIAVLTSDKRDATESYEAAYQAGYKAAQAEQRARNEARARKAAQTRRAKS